MELTTQIANNSYQENSSTQLLSIIVMVGIHSHGSQVRVMGGTSPQKSQVIVMGGTYPHNLKVIVMYGTHMC